MIKIGDLVTREKYNNDIVFKVIDIRGNNCYLKGICVRLMADSDIDDLNIYDDDFEDDFEAHAGDYKSLDRDEYFYLPGKILHIDTEFQLNNTLANPYKIRKKSIFENGKIN